MALNLFKLMLIKLESYCHYDTYFRNVQDKINRSNFTGILFSEKKGNHHHYYSREAVLVTLLGP